MQNVIIYSVLALILIASGTIALYIYRINSRIENLNKTLEHQYNLIVKIQSVLKNKSATNAIA